MYTNHHERRESRMTTTHSPPRPGNIRMAFCISCSPRLGSRTDNYHARSDTSLNFPAQARFSSLHSGPRYIGSVGKTKPNEDLRADKFKSLQQAGPYWVWQLQRYVGAKSVATLLREIELQNLQEQRRCSQTCIVFRILKKILEFRKIIPGFQIETGIQSIQ